MVLTVADKIATGEENKMDILEDRKE